MKRGAREGEKKRERFTNLREREREKKERGRRRRAGRRRRGREREGKESMQSIDSSVTDFRSNSWQ